MPSNELRPSVARTAKFAAPVPPEKTPVMRSRVTPSEHAAEADGRVLTRDDLTPRLGEAEPSAVVPD